MRADLRTALENMARLDQAADARDKVLEEVISKIDIELPTALVDAELEARRQQVSQQLTQAGMTVEEYLEESEEEADNADDFWAEIEKRSLDALKAQVVLDKMADDDEIGVEQNELTELLFRKAQQNGTSPEEEAQHMMQHNHLPDWMQEIRRGKALASMVGTATVKDSKGEALELDRIQPDGTIADKPAETENSDEEAEGKAEASAEEAKAEKKSAAKKPTAKKAPAKKPAAKKTTSKKPADKDKADEKPAAKKSAAKKSTAAKSTKSAAKEDKSE